MTKNNELNLINQLMLFFSAGKLNVKYVRPVLKELTQGDIGYASISSLIDAIANQEGNEAKELLTHLNHCRLQEAKEFYHRSKMGSVLLSEFDLMLGDLPLSDLEGWESNETTLSSLPLLISLAQDHRFISDNQNIAPITASHIQKKYSTVLKNGLPNTDEWHLELPIILIQELKSRMTESDNNLSSNLDKLLHKYEISNINSKVLTANPSLKKSTSSQDDGHSLLILASEYKNAKTEEDKKQFLQLLCISPNKAVANILRRIVQEPRMQEFASLILTCRFGTRATSGWEGWVRWFHRCELERQHDLKELKHALKNNPGDFFLIWYSNQENIDPLLLNQIEQWQMEQWSADHAGKVDAETFVERWSEIVPAKEWNSLTGTQIGDAVSENKLDIPDNSPTEYDLAESLELPKDDSKVTPLYFDEVPHSQNDTADEPALISESVSTPEPQGPSLWGDHIQPFFAENWYMFAGVIMMIAGSSLLAYYTWDKHWLVRYTIMPALLGSFTAALAWMASWIEQKDEQFAGTAAILRGAAIGLLPINFMAVALLSNDDQVSGKSLVVPLMGAIYIIVFGLGLKKWCGAVYRPLGWLLGGTLLVINSLVMLAPLATNIAQVTDHALLVVVGTGFHLGFLIIAAAILQFSNKIMTQELAEQKRIPVFFGTTLIITFLQVFFWVHGSLQHLPQISTYAPMLILTGGLVLLVERRSLQLRKLGNRYEEESFIGFALILAGVLMGMTQPYIRILSFLLAGIVWLTQSASRKQAIHDWIGLTFFMLAGASVGLLESFPKPWLPAIGLVIALLMTIGSSIASRFGQTRLQKSCLGVQASVLLLTTIVAVLNQWHYLTPPLYTGGCLLLIFVLFAYRAWQNDQLKWMHTAMAILALSLLYLGCADMIGQTTHGNTMVFGLSVISILWLCINGITSKPVVRDARSTVLWVYGSLAVAGMLLRVTVERGNPEDILWYRQFMDYSGPLLMSGVLIFAAWFSRSLIPSIMAAIIVVILFPELKANFSDTFDKLGWGSGLGSALSSFGLILFCFPLKQLRSLKNLSDGDRFMGKVLFPLRRYDHSLFTLPILASVLFLTIKTDTFTLARHWLSTGAVGMHTSIAVLITGITWTLFAIYNKRYIWAQLATYSGCFWLFIGIWNVYNNLVDSPHWTWPVLATMILLQIAYFSYVGILKPKTDWADHVLVKPTLAVLQLSSFIISIICIHLLVNGAEISPLTPLLIFVSAQLTWHSLSNKTQVYSCMLFVLGWIGLLTYTAPGTEHLIYRISVQSSLMPTLWMILGVQILYLTMEFKQEIHQKVRSLTSPFFMAATFISIALIMFGLIDVFYEFRITSTQFSLLCLTAIITARAHTSNAILLPIILLVYAFSQRDELLLIAGNGFDIHSQRLKHLYQPLLLSKFAVIIVLVGHVGRLIYRTKQNLISGPFGLRFLRSTDIFWLFIPAGLFAIFATIYQTSSPSLRESPIQLWAPYLAALTFALMGTSWWRNTCYQVGVLLLTVSNIHAVRVLYGFELRDLGISEIQLACLGIAATLLQGTIVKYLFRRKNISIFINQASLGLAGLLLVSLTANYFVHPNLAIIPWERFVLSGMMAYLSGLYFRRAARHPDAGEETYGDLCEGLYHFGVTVAIWCTILLIPWFRQPTVALCSLGFPVIYFYARAENGIRHALDSGRQYRNSASVLSFILIFCYIFRAGFQMVLFPDEPIIQTDYFHTNAPFIILLSFVILRLHGLGGTSWLAFYGGLSLLVGTYFSVTWLPGLSPFRHPVPAAWVAIALSHFWTLVSHQQSPLRTGIQQLALIDGPQWFTLRRSWGVCLLVTTQAAVIWGLLDWQSNTYLVAPLLLGAASILIHHGVIRNSSSYFGLAVLQIMLALHADFWIESYLQKEFVVWVILGVWGAILLTHQLLFKRIELKNIGTTTMTMAILSMLHVYYHHPCSSTGLWVVAIGGILATLTPRKTRVAQTGEQFTLAGLLLIIPAWLIFFSQVPLMTEGVSSIFDIWPLLCTTAALFLTGSFSAEYQKHLHYQYESIVRVHPRLFDQTLSLMGLYGISINTVTLLFSFMITVAVQILHYGKPFETDVLILIMSLYGAFSLGWYFEGKLRRNISSYILLQLSLLGFFSIIRRQLILTTQFWTPEYDVWTSLVVSFALTGFKQIFDSQRREVRIPLLGTLFTLPIVALIWVYYNHLGTNVSLLIVGLHSLMFTFMGKDEKESPYNIIAIIGFLAFVLMSFWSKLELRVIHAYTIPVGIAVLVLLQIFRQHIEADTRNRIRLVTLLVMIGSTGFYALVDDSYPVIFNLVLIAVCLSSMALGSFFRIRLYLILGFAGLVIDICSLLFKSLRVMERSSQMTIVGSMVLLVGVSLVFGAIYYKTNRERINQKLNHLRSKLGGWE